MIIPLDFVNFVIDFVVVLIYLSDWSIDFELAAQLGLGRVEILDRKRFRVELTNIQI